MADLFCRCRRIFVTGAASFAMWSGKAKASGIITSGAMSALGFDGAGIVLCPCDGTKGIFALGGTPTLNATRNKYTYATDASTACGVGAASLANGLGTAAGNSTRGIFQLGETSSGSCTYNTRNKYTYATCASASATAASFGSLNGGAAGNSTRGIFAIGCAVGPGACCIGVCRRDKYTYASSANAALSGLTNFSAGSVVGTSTIGIFTIGLNNTARRKYTYSSDTETTATAASSIVSNGPAAGNCTRGIIALGRAGSARDKYTYASNTSVAATAASVSNSGGSAAGNSTRGIFAMGATTACLTPSTTRNKYTYASDISTASGVGAASSASNYGAAASWVVGVNV